MVYRASSKTGFQPGYISSLYRSIDIARKRDEQQQQQQLLTRDEGKKAEKNFRDRASVYEGRVHLKKR